MAEFITQTVGWKPAVRYLGFSTDVNANFVWARGTDSNESYSTLRRILVENGRLRVAIAHGYFDIACPYFADQLAVDLIPAAAGRDRVKLWTYPGGHMFYRRPDSLRQFTRDAAASLYSADPQ